MIFLPNQNLKSEKVNVNRIQCYIQNKNVYQSELTFLNSLPAPNQQFFNVKSVFKLRDHISNS